MLKLTFRVGAMALALALSLAPAPASGQTDAFSASVDTVTAPSRHASPITPSDTADLTLVPKGIYVGVGGDVSMIGVGAPSGATGIVFKALPAGSIIPFRARRVLATGTTATFLVALY